MFALQESEALASKVELLPMEQRLSQASTAEAAAQVQESDRCSQHVAEFC